jgi:endonuclease YncB( thermonuclease family)
LTLAAGAILIALVVSVTDGDTFRLDDGTIVRLSGIAAPEMHERGGREARAFVLARAIGQAATCVADGYRSYKREVMACEINGEDVGALLQSRGLARACHVRGKRRYSPTDDSPNAEPRRLPGYCR